MRLIDADKLLTKAQDYGEGQEKLILIDPYYVKNAKTVQAIPIPDNATNYDVLKAVFGNTSAFRIKDTMEFEKGFESWFSKPYKRGDSDGSN